MGKDLLKSWVIGMAITLVFYGLIWLTHLSIGVLFFFPFGMLANSLAFRIAAGSSLETPLFVAFALALGGIYYGGIAFIVVRFRARRKPSQTAAG